MGIQAVIVYHYWLSLSVLCYTECAHVYVGARVHVCVCVCVSELHIDSLTLWRCGRGMDSRLPFLLTGLLWLTCGWNGGRIDNVANILFIDCFLFWRGSTHNLCKRLEDVCSVVYSSSHCWPLHCVWYSLSWIIDRPLTFCVSVRNLWKSGVSFSFFHQVFFISGRSHEI